MAGVWSNGMLCSTRELGLGDDHEGIYLLPHGLEPGTPFAEAMGIEPDVLYDLEINPNRPDAMSVAGVAATWPPGSACRSAARPEARPPWLRSGSPACRRDPRSDRCGSFEARVLRDVRSVGRPEARPAAWRSSGCGRSTTSSTCRTT
jgi:phenylalanyl-tRNA synthetase beta chain